jgi:hypothetical protein
MQRRRGLLSVSDFSCEQGIWGGLTPSVYVIPLAVRRPSALRRRVRLRQHGRRDPGPRPLPLRDVARYPTPRVLDG